jgi:ankyrin repeat protein
VELKDEATWNDLKKEIEKVTGVPLYPQKLEPNGKYNKKCELEEGDDVFCDWRLPDGNHPLHYLARSGNIEAIRSWIASGADVNVVNEHKKTPLMFACLYLKEGSVVELLRLGANVKLAK